MPGHPARNEAPMHFLFGLDQPAASSPAHSRLTSWLLGALLLLPGLIFAGPSPRQLANYQQRMRAIRFDYRYWDANHDSLRQVLASQRAETARLQTIDHLISLTDNSRDSLSQLLRERREALAITRKLQYPEQETWRLLVAYDQLCQARVPNLLAMRDTLLAALHASEALGNRPQLYLLEAIRNTNIALNQPATNRFFFTQRLERYQRTGEVVNMATCYRALGNYYISQGDANQGISMRLHAAELFRTFSASRYYNELCVIGVSYVDWGNSAQALPYLRKAAAWPRLITVNWRYVNRNIAYIYAQQERYALALHYDSLALRPRKAPDGAVADYDRALGLVQQSATLLALGRAAAARPLVEQAQHLVDSLQIPLYSKGGNCELHATWARYYAGTGDMRRAESAWQAAYQQARRERRSILKLKYLRLLAGFYQQRGQATRAAPYALAALALADTLEIAQIPTRVARYEFERVDQAQQSRLARLRLAEEQATAQTQRQRRALGGLLAGLAGVAGLAVLLWRTTRRQQRDNARLAAQQQQLEAQAQRLGELDAAKNQFFANTSHELRTPLTLVLAPLETLLANPARPLPAAVRAPMALAYRQAQRLNELVDCILDLTKLQAGRLPVTPTLTAMAPWLRRVVAQFEGLANERGLRLLGPTALPEALHLLVDAGKLEQILTNLLSNALKHTPAGGTVTVEAAFPGPDGRYLLTVHDTGPGIAAAEHERVFERFYQSPQNQAQGGTGLGLALSRELATLLGGTLTLASQPGTGAAFTLTFAAEQVTPDLAELETNPIGRPFPPDAPILDAYPAALSAPTARPRVLVVEDEPDLREYLRELLSVSCEVLVAADGQAALELLVREAPVDLITTDAMMPRLSGTELLAQLKAIPALAGVPVLMLTARADDAHHQFALTVGVDDYLTKPFVAAELLARVRALLAHHNVRRHFATLPTSPVELATPTVAALAAAPAAIAETEPPLPKTDGLLAQWQLKVRAYLADEQFGPAELATLLCLSERTLYRRLGGMAGLTPAAWLRELRLNQARQLLEAGDFGTVADVAQAVGFASSRYFNTCYTERFGRRPSNYSSPQK
jgi:two-component system NtrC family sensor kinase